MVEIRCAIKTQGLSGITDEGLRRTINNGVKMALGDWYVRSYKVSLSNILRKGSGMKETRGEYRRKKKNKYGYTHAFGQLTGRLYNGVMNTVPSIRVVKGREVRIGITYNTPYYAPYLHDGFTAKGFATGHPNAKVPMRPFAFQARDNTLETLDRYIAKVFQGLNLLERQPALVGSMYRQPDEGYK